jgi:hypothetical protein
MLADANLKILAAIIPAVRPSKTVRTGRTGHATGK